MAADSGTRGWAVIAVATATGISIVALAYSSRRLFHEPISDLYLSIPALMATFHQAASQKAGGSWIGKTSTWVVAILLVTGLIIGIGWN